MSLAGAAALFWALLVLAAIPSLSVLLVTTRAVSAGLGHGVAASAGIVLGDLVYVALAVFGLVVLAELLGPWFHLLKYAAGLYLIWLGVQLWRHTPTEGAPSPDPGNSLAGSVAAGLLLTLADQKAIVFYFAFFPAFVRIDDLSGPDLALIAVITIVAVGGVKTLYACLAVRGTRWVSSKWTRILNVGAAIVLVIAGVSVMVRA